MTSFWGVRLEICQDTLDATRRSAYVKEALTKEIAMAASARKSPLSCSFCGKSETEVSRLLGGPGVHICDACVGVCNNILAATPTDFAGWDKMSDPDLLAALKVAEASVDGARAVLQAQVDELRRRSVSWEAIGSALGVSRQAAWERFS
jgi:hypothetical protein